jgi:hypothetical protein
MLAHTFFDILISSRYQLHPASATTYFSSGITDAQPNKREKNYKKEKSRYSDQFLEIAIQTPPRQHQKSSFSINDASKKRTKHKHHRRPIIDLRFSS